MPRIIHGGHLKRDGAGDDHHIALAGRRAEDFGAEARDIEARPPGSHHSNRAAGKAKRHRPDCGFARPIEDVVDGGDERALFKSALKQVGHLISV
jgi:hypothetical protein